MVNYAIFAGTMPCNTYLMELWSTFRNCGRKFIDFLVCLLTTQNVIYAAKRIYTQQLTVCAPMDIIILIHIVTFLFNVNVTIVTGASGPLVHLRGAGASFPSTVYNKWLPAYHVSMGVKHSGK